MITAIATLILVAANPAEADPGPQFQDLGEQFVNSLRNEDVAEYAQCWISFRRLQSLAIASKIPVSKKLLEKMKAYSEDRNRHVVHSFKVLTDLFKKEGNIKQLKLVKIEAKVRKKDGLRSTSMWHVTVAMGAVKYEIDIDDGIEDDGTWFFSDKPLTVENLAAGKKLIHLRKPDK